MGSSYCKGARSVFSLRLRAAHAQILAAHGDSQACNRHMGIIFLLLCVIAQYCGEESLGRHRSAAYRVLLNKMSGI